jgi:hypothetical protein
MDSKIINKQYFITKDNSPHGPLSFEELKEESISRETLVWHAGLDQWQKAETIKELQSMFKTIPPPPPVSPNSPNYGNFENPEPVKRNTGCCITTAILIVLKIIAIGIFALLTIYLIGMGTKQFFDIVVSFNSTSEGIGRAIGGLMVVAIAYWVAWLLWKLIRKIVKRI